MITSAQEFVRLRESEDMDEQRRAGHEPAPLAVWLEVIRDYPHKKEWVAYNKTVPIEILEMLSKDRNSRVRDAVAMKNKLTRELMETLSRDRASSVRHSIACNKNVPREVLMVLAQDPVPEIAAIAVKRLSDASRWRD